jgi:hypothetical protein
MSEQFWFQRRDTMSSQSSPLDQYQPHILTDMPQEELDRRLARANLQVEEVPADLPYLLRPKGRPTAPWKVRKFIWTPDHDVVMPAEDFPWLFTDWIEMGFDRITPAVICFKHLKLNDKPNERTLVFEMFGTHQREDGAWVFWLRIRDMSDRPNLRLATIADAMYQFQSHTPRDYYRHETEWMQSDHMRTWWVFHDVDRTRVNSPDDDTTEEDES